MIKVEFKGAEPLKRLTILRDVFASSAFGFDLEKRSQMILVFHPEWLQVTRGDYVRFIEAARLVASAITAGTTKVVDDLWNAILEEYRPLLLERIGVDTGQLFEDIQTASIFGSKGAVAGLGEQD